MAAGTIRLVSGPAADTPPAGCVHIYAKPNGYLYAKNDTGLEYPLGTLPNYAVEVEYIQLDATAIANEQITLAQLPLEPTMVTLDIISGSAQIYSEDFIVTGNILSWAGKPLSVQLEIGDTCRIGYTYSP